MRWWALTTIAMVLLANRAESNSVRLGAKKTQEESSASRQNPIEDSPQVVGSESKMEYLNSNVQSGWTLKTLGLLVGRLQSRFPIFGNGDDLIDDFATTDVFETSDMSSSSTTSTTTTVDPMEAYCEIACEEGIAGPECDCPGHPVG